MARLGRARPQRNIFTPSSIFVTATISGTAIAGGVLESEIVSGGETVIIDLINDTWKAPGTANIGDTADTQALIDGFDSAQSEGAGWNVEVRDKEVVSSIVRTSDTKATWTITAAGSYVVTADETITLTIPAAALTISAVDVDVAATFDVTNESAGARLGLMLMGVGA